MKTTTLILFSLGISFLHAQVTETLNANSVNATISNSPVFFNDDINNVAAYEIPAGSNKHSIYASSLWVAGEDINGQVYVSAETFTSAGWSPGPIADLQYYNSTNYMNAYGSSIWKVSRQQVLDHQAQYQQTGYTPIPEIANWPGNGDVSMSVADQLAPFIDINSNGIYEPLDGDYPEFPGDEVVYVILNDEASPQQTFLGVEVHLMFYQFNNTGYLGETTFLNTRVFNRSTTDYYNFRQSIYADFDIGNYQDDYFGCDSSRNMIYIYNGDALDETNGGALGYGATPPCQAVASLNRDIFSVAYYTNGAVYPTSDPGSELEFWNYMNGVWADGATMYYGGNGYNSSGTTTTPTTFAFTGNPYTGTGWTELNSNGGSPNPPEDRRGVMTNHVGDLPIGGSICSDFAFIYDDDDGHLENVQNVMNIADALQTLYNSTSATFPCGLFIVNTPELDPLEFTVFPNPSSGAFSLQLANAFDPVIVEVRDMTGRLVYSETTQSELTQIQLDAPAGVYQISVQSPLQRTTKSIVVQ